MRGEAEKSREVMAAFGRGLEEVRKLLKKVMSRVWVS